MPPKNKYSKDEVIRAAVNVVEENGLDSLTARAIALKLDSSTAPVYSQFDTMDELALCVVKKIEKALLEYTTRPWTDRVFLNMGTGIGMYALEHPRLYRALMLEGDNYGDIVREFFDTLAADLPKDVRFKSLSAGERNALLTKMWTYTHGLASLICVGLIKDCDKDYIIKALVDIGTDVIGATMARHAQGAKGD